MSNSLPGTQRFLSRLWGDLTDFEESPVRNGIAELRIRMNIGKLGDGDLDVRRKAILALVNFGLPAVPALIVALRDGNSTVRENAAWALGKIARKHPEYDWSSVVPALILALRNGLSNVRIGAAWALGKIAENHPEYDWSGAVHALILALKDGNSWVGRDATEALVNIGLPAVPALIDALEEEESPAIRTGAALALGKIAEKHPEHDWTGAVPVLIFTLGDRNSEVRKMTVSALGAIAGEHPEYDWGLGVPALIVALGDRDSGVRGNAVLALANIGLAVVPALVVALKDGDSDVRRSAALALGTIAEKHPEYDRGLAVPALVVALKDGDSGVRGRAAQALEKIGPRDYNDLNALIPIARKLKSEKEEFEPVMGLYSKWLKALSERADRGFADKRFHVPKVKPEKTERVMRVRRSCA